MHRTIGILGGMSPESTAMYYEYIRRTYKQRFGDFCFPDILIYSVNFQKFTDLQRERRWMEAAGEMAEALEMGQGQQPADFAHLSIVGFAGSANARCCKLSPSAA